MLQIGNAKQSTVAHNIGLLTTPFTINPHIIDLLSTPFTFNSNFCRVSGR